jgi:aminodeoxyfutalosine deaminase
MYDFIAGLPKVELHRHLEGSIRPATVFALAQEHGVDVGADSVDELAESYVFGDFPSFVELFIKTTKVLRRSEDLELIVTEMAREMADENIRYAEIFFSPVWHRMNGMTERSIAAGMNAGRNAAAGFGIELAWIVDNSRHLEVTTGFEAVDFVTGPNAPDGVVAVGLGGPEAGFPPEPWKPVFDKARAAGLESIPHAGEMVGADSVRGAVTVLGAKRIGHGVRCLEDPEVVSMLVDRGIPVDVSLTSNRLLGVVASDADHPLNELVAAGLQVTLNTDDPGLFRTTLTKELALAVSVHGLTGENLTDHMRVAVHNTCLPAARKRSLSSEIDGYAPR